MNALLWVGLIISMAMMIFFAVTGQEGKIRAQYAWVGSVGSFTLSFIFATILSVTGL